MSHRHRVEDHLIASHGETLAARLHLPEGEGSFACVVLGQGWGLVKEAQVDRFASRFADAGLGAVTFDYSHFGSSTGEPRQLIDIHRQQEDIASVIEWARADGRVDPKRIGLWGYSYGGGHAIETAARDPRVAAVVAHAPFTDGRVTAREVTKSRGPRFALRLLVLGVRNRLRVRRGRQPLLLPIVGDAAADAVFIGSEEVGYRSIVPERSTWRNEYAQINWMPYYRPIRSAGKVACPLLVVVGGRDKSVPLEPARKVASLAPRGVLRECDAGHFDMFFGELGERILEEEIAFLGTHLGDPRHPDLGRV